MSNQLIERYIYAVTKRMPRKMGQDISKELSALIYDMLEERCGENPPCDKDVRVVLTELGTPDELYEKYDSDDKKCLIGSPHYSIYKLILKIVLPCVALGVSISCIMLFVIQPSPWYMTLLKWLGMLFGSLFCSFSAITLIFAILYHKNINVDHSYNLSDLPPVPKKSETIPKLDSIMGIAFSIVFLVIFLFFPQIIFVYYEGQSFPFFNLPVLQSLWPVILAFGLLGIIREIFRLLDGKITNRVLWVSLIVDALSVPLAFFFLCRPDIVNPHFNPILTELFASNLASLTGSTIQYLFLGVILFALALDAGVTIFKSMSARNNRD